MKNIFLITNVFYWLSRILAICFILFLSLFALDVFSGEFPFWEQLIGFLIHLTPNFILLVLLFVAWKKPIIGGIGFMGLSIIFTFFFKTYTLLPSFLLISLPPFLIGVLFIADAYNQKRRESMFFL